jgi:hypothetical protein
MAGIEVFPPIFLEHSAQIGTLARPVKYHNMQRIVFPRNGGTIMQARALGNEMATGVNAGPKRNMQRGIDPALLDCNLQLQAVS